MSDFPQAPLPPRQSRHDSYTPRMFDEAEYQRRQDEDQLRLLAIFHYVMGALAGLTALWPLIYVGLGVMMLAMPSNPQASSDPPPAFMGYLFMGIGLVGTILFAAVAFLTIRAGIALNARKGLTLIQVMACINCLHMPIGTVLGIFTLIVVNRPSVRALFERQEVRGRYDGIPEVDRPSLYDR